MNIMKKALPAIFICLITVAVIAIISFTIDKDPEYMISDDAVFYTIEDIEKEYSNTGKYKDFMIADESDSKYIFSTVEDYVEAKVGIGSKCITCGLFKDKNRYVYEIAVFNNGMNNDPTYFMLDTDYCVLYEVDTLMPIVEGKEMLKELDTIEEEYMKTQKKNMTKYEEESIFNYDYVNSVTKKIASSSNIKYDVYKNMGLIKKDNMVYYQVNFSLNDNNEIYLVNALTCDMIKIK